MARARNARQSIRLFASQPPLHHPVTVRGQQKSSQQDGELSLRERNRNKRRLSWLKYRSSFLSQRRQTMSYPHWQVGPEVDDKYGDGLTPVIDGVNDVQAFFLLSVQHPNQSWNKHGGGHASTCHVSSTLTEMNQLTAWTHCWHPSCSGQCPGPTAQRSPAVEPHNPHGSSL